MIARREPPSFPSHEVPSSTFCTMLGYSSGNLGKSFVWTAFESVLLYFLVSQSGMTLPSAGILLTSLMVWDGLADLAIAYRTDRTGRQAGLANLIRVGAPLCAVSFAMIFAAPAFGGMILTVIAVIAGRIGYTLCDVGHNTLLIRVASNERNAGTVSGLRLIFSALGAGCVGLALTQILGTHDMGKQCNAFIAFGLVGGAVYFITLFTARKATLHLPFASSAGSARVAVRVLLKRMISNASYRQVLGVIAIQSALIPFFTRALPFLSVAAFDDAAWSGWALTGVTLGQSLSLPLWMLVAKRRSSRDILVIGHVGLLVSMAGLALTFGISAAAVFLGLLGASQAAMNMSVWALLASSVKSGKVDGSGGEALPVGLFLATLKAASGVGTTLLTSVLALSEAGGTGGLRSVNLVMYASTGIPMIGSALILLVSARSRPSAGCAVS
jgi:Na+/melibiose symporter-like transporter